MRPIIILEPNIANKIAAGEVVERPASIVKELLENALDAGATAITVEMRNGGIDHIRITDNGCGINENELKLAFMRHATSKLSSIEDLNSLSSFGFRGEALASIAAVSKVTVRTRTENAEFGAMLRIEGGSFSEVEPCACPQGTTIEVDELFYNVPARLKFVKNARTEAAMIADFTSRIMLANPDVSIKLINSGRTVLHTLGGGSLANAVLCVYGSSVFSSMYEVAYDDGYISVTGYVGGELTARSNRIQQSVFINSRYIKSNVVSNAVQRAFLTRVMKHRFPFFVLNVLLSAREVDVNVHPNKLSVRFRDEERVSSAVTAAINAALAKQPVSLSAADITMQPYSKQEQNQHKESAYSQTAVRADKQKNPYSTLEADVRELFKSESDAETEEVAGFEEKTQHVSGADEEAQAAGEKPFSEGAVKPFSEFLPYSSHSPNSNCDFSLRDSGASAYPDFSGAAPNSPQQYQPSLYNISNDNAEGTGGTDSTSVNVDANTGGNADVNGAEVALNASEHEASSLNGIPVYTVPAPKIKEQYSEVKAEQIALDADTCTVIGAVFDTYIIVQQADAVYYIDQHAAHERILYEKLISGSLKFDSQFLTPPMELEFDPVSFDCLNRNIERFTEFGYSIEFDGESKALVYAVPSIQFASAERFLRDAVDMMLEHSDTSEVDLMRSRLIQMSCKRAVKAGNDLEIRQLKAIVDAYATGEVPLTCPHGRPVIIRITKTELQKMFKRIV